MNHTVRPCAVQGYYETKDQSPPPGWRIIELGVSCNSEYNDAPDT